MIPVGEVHTSDRPNEFIIYSKRNINIGKVKFRTYVPKMYLKNYQIRQNSVQKYFVTQTSNPTKIEWFYPRKML